MIFKYFLLISIFSLSLYTNSKEMKNYKVVETNTKNTYWYDNIDEVILFLSNIDIDWSIFSNIGNYQHGLKCFKKQAENKFNQTIFDACDVKVKNMRRDSNLNILLDI